MSKTKKEQRKKLMQEENKKRFLSRPAESNTEWASQRILQEFTSNQLMELQACIQKLDEVLFKGWSKDLTLQEIKEAVQIAAEYNNIQ